jgi:hypothetical protein
MAYAGFEAVKGVGEYIKSTIEAIGETKILAERVGFSVEAFQKLAYAARLAHVDQDTLAVSLGQMSKRLGEVALEGSGPAADALKRFGLDAKALAMMGPEKAFGVLLNVFEKITNPMERSKIAMDLFGKSGQGMINIIAQGGPELRKMGEDASRLGFAMNGIQVARAVEAEEAMIKLGSAAQGFGNLLAVELAPYLTLIIEKYTEWAYASDKSTSFIATGMNTVVNVIGVVVDSINVLGTAFYGLRGVITMAIAGIMDLLQGFVATLQQTMYTVATAVGYLSTSARDSIDNAAKSLDGFRTIIQLSSEEMDKAARTDFSKAADSFKSIGSGAERIKTLMNDINTAANERAQIAAKKGAEFIHPGELHDKHEPLKFGAATELGTKANYSAVLAAKGLQSSGEKEMLKSSRITADATSGSLAVLKTISAAMKAAGAGELKLAPDS